MFEKRCVGRNRQKITFRHVNYYNLSFKGGESGMISLKL